MKSVLYNKVPVNDIPQSDAILLFRKTSALDLDTLDTFILPTEYLIGYIESSSEGKLIFSMDSSVGLQYYDSAMDTIILLQGQDVNGKRLGYSYITPINPAKYGTKNLKLDISYEIKEEEDKVEFIIDISDNNPQNLVNEYSNSYSDVYSDEYLQSRTHAKSYDYEEGSRQIAGHLMIGDQRLDYIDRVKEIHDLFLSIKRQSINTQQFRINQIKYYDSDLPKFNAASYESNDPRYSLTTSVPYFIIRDNYTNKDRLFLMIRGKVVDDYLIIPNLPDIYWNYMESYEITHYMYNQDHIAISHINNGVKYAKYTDRVVTWSDYIKGHISCCNEDYVVIYNEGVYKLIHKDSGKIKEFDASRFMFRMNNGRIYLVSLITGRVYDHEFMQMVGTNTTAYKSNSYGTLSAINWYNGRIIAGSKPTIESNKIIFAKTYLIRDENAYDLGISTELHKVPTRDRHNNYDFLSDKVIIFPDTPIVVTGDNSYVAKEATPVSMIPFMNALTQEGLGEDEKLLVMRGMLLKISDDSINLY